MPGYIEDRWLKKRPNKLTGKRERTALWGTRARYRVKGIPGVKDRSFETSEDAKKWLATAKSATARGEFVDPRDGQILLVDYIEKDWWPSRTDEPSTAASMRSRIWNHLIPLLGTTALRDIDAAALRSFKASLLARVESSTAEVIWIHLSTILAAATEDGRLAKNPCKVHRSIKPPKRIKSKAKAWNQPRVAAARTGLQERYRFAVDLGVGLGVRQGEAFGLDEDDFDFTNMIVHVRRQLRWARKGAFTVYPRGRRPAKFRCHPTSPDAPENTSAVSPR